MPSYEYQALDAQGKKVNGHISADSQRQARESLRRKQLIPVSLTEEKGRKDSSGAQSKSLFQIKLFRTKIPLLDLMVFTRQLSTLMSSGMPLDQSLSLMMENTERKSLTGALVQLRTMITEGFSLAQSLRKTKVIFPLDYIATIAAGEESGRLPEVLTRLADDLEQQSKTRQSLSSALIYPIMLVFICITIVVVLMVMVVPRVTRVFEEQDQELPQLTKIMIAISEFLIANGIYVLWVLLIGVLTFSFMLRREAFRYKVHKYLVEMPVVGRWFELSIAIRWARSLGILLASGVPSLQALHLASDGVQNLHRKKQLQSVTDRVREGESLSKALKDTQCMPQFLVHMISSGENSANLDSMLIRASDYYDQTLQMTVESSLKVFEPLLILFMGGLVLAIVLSVLLPIFGINQLIV